MSQVIREAILMINVLGLIITLYITYQIVRRGSREVNKITPNNGLALYFVFFFLYYFLAVISFFYFEGFYSDILQNLSIISIDLGMFFFVFFTERYFQTHSNMAKLTGIHPIHTKLRLTVIMSPLLAIIIFLPILLNWSLTALFINIGLMSGMIILYAITNTHYANIFESLEIVHRKKAPVKFTVGITLAGASNGFRGLVATIGIFAMLLIGIFMVIGGILVANAWSDYPDLVDLKWIMQLERLLVIKKEEFVPIFDHSFQKEEKIIKSNQNAVNEDKATSKDSKVDASLAGGALGGISSMLKEILETQSNIKKIDHEEKSILFNHGREVIFVLIVDNYHYEQTYHLDEFALEFERKFRNELEEWTGDVTPFSKAKGLIDTIFQ
jgi:hypothetical protein